MNDLKGLNKYRVCSVCEQEGLDIILMSVLHSLVYTQSQPKSQQVILNIDKLVLTSLREAKTQNLPQLKIEGGKTKQDQP